MASSPIPAPQQSNPGPGGGFAAPAPAQADASANAAMQSCMDIVSNARMIASKFPQATSKVRQINDLVQQIIQDVKGGQMPTEPKAPPV